MSEKEIKNYYDYTVPFYKLFWHGETRGIHYGYFDETTSSLESAIENTNRQLAKNSSFDSKSVVADLGCGVGGSAFWLAKQTGATVHGITLSRAQYKKANDLQVRLKLEDKTFFYLGSYFETPFADNTFDVVWRLEALCYGQPRVAELVAEIYRILKPGGMFVMADGFLGDKVLSSEEQHGVKVFCEGFQIDHMITAEAFERALVDKGFTNVAYTDWTKQILPSAQRMYALSKRWFWFIYMCVRLRLVPTLMLSNIKTGMVQKELFENRALVYGCITAKK